MTLPPPSSTSPPFDLRSVQAALARTRFAESLHYLERASSTQDLALSAAQRGERCGVWIAGEQTAGRGRGDHTWHSAADDGLYLSALVTPSLSLAHALHLSLATALAAQDAITEITGYRPREQIDIRWPNDLILCGRKCGGILIETAIETRVPADAAAPPRLRHAVIGIGINCNHTRFPAALDSLATSLRRESRDPRRPIAREPLLASLLLHLDRALDRLVHAPTDSAGTDLLHQLALRSSWVQGKQVAVGTPEVLFRGVTDGLTPEGFLRVLDPRGELRIVRSGGVREPA